ncbi:MAG: hypothetical protein JWP58_19 [Hymenobacter sp.]|nr:hypothetical protein [Hymenobacter sp.]
MGWMSIAGAHAAGHPKPLTTAQAEARNEKAAPAFSGQLYEARRVSNFLADALVLTNAQQHAVQAYTVAKFEALSLAVIAADTAEALQQYRQAVRRMLAPSQRDTYAVLCQHQTDTLLPLDSSVLVLR